MSAADPEQRRQREQLLAAIEAALDDGLQVPCLGPESHAWTSEDVQERTVAARACRSCPVLSSCRTYGERWPLEQGVYGANPDLTRSRQEKSA